MLKTLRLTSAGSAATCAALLGFALLPGCATPTLAPPSSVGADVASRAGVAPSWTGDNPQAAPDARSLRAAANTPLPSPLDEREAVAIALNQSPEVATMIAETAALRAEALESASPINPVVNFTTAVPLDSMSVVPFFIMLMGQVDELWKQPIRSEVARDSYEAVLLALSAKVVALATEARTLWHEVALREAELALAQHDEALTEKLLAWERERLAVGEANPDAVTAAQSELVDVHRRAQRALQMLTEARLSLMALLGRADGSTQWKMGTADPAVNTAIHASIGDESELLDQMANARLDVRAAQARARAAEHALALARASRIGSLQLGSGWERDMEDASGVGLVTSVEIPLLNDGSHRIAKALAECEAASIAAERARQDAVIELRIALARVTSAESQHESASLGSAEPSRKLVARAQAALDAGEGAAQSVIDAQHSYNKVALDLNNLERERRTARLSLWKAAGFLPSEVIQ
ncbi:MAG: TolC family protein [Phycisphaerales bacterium]|nr:TolC family protein [Phycisphaerales bacterium]